VEVKHLGVDVGVGYFSFIDTDMVRGADSHPAIGPLRQDLPGPFGKTHSLAAVGEAVATGIAERRRWVVVPAWARALLVLRTALAPLMERGALRAAEEAERRFRADVDERGVVAASALVGAGGEAAREREPA
jgi:hypothetical protein